MVRTYTREDVIAAMNAVYPYDWRTFFARRVDAIAPHPPDAFSRSGYRLVFTTQENENERNREDVRHTQDLRYSLGIVIDRDGIVRDVLTGSPAARAGLAPGSKILAVRGREYTSDHMTRGIEQVAHETKPLELMVQDAKIYRTIEIDYHGGLRYPHLVRTGTGADYLRAAVDSRAQR